MLKSPLSLEAIKDAARMLFTGNNIPRSVWDNLSDTDKFAVNEEVDRLEDEANETPNSPASGEMASTPKI